MIGETATKMMNGYTLDPESVPYKRLQWLFLRSGETPQEIMDHGGEWHHGSGRMELMTLVDHCPKLAQSWYDACCAVLSADRSFETRWRTPHNRGVWHPSEGTGNLDSRSSIEVDDSGEKVVIKVNTPVIAVRELASYAKA